jgi:ribulose-5-phosphate 4-epimerase/fuculose-1-phosphate aldolase
MRVGHVKRLDYVRPGDEKAGDLIRALGGKYAAILLANHGPVVTGKDIVSAVYAAEELEETAKLLVMLRGMPTRILSDENVAELNAEYGCC